MWDDCQFKVSSRRVGGRDRERERERERFIQIIKLSEKKKTPQFSN